MQFLCIGVNESAGRLKECLANELNSNNKLCKKYRIIDVIDSEGSTSIECHIEEENEHSDIYFNLYNELVLNVSDVLANYIIDEYEEKLILRIINSNYCYFNSVEKKEIQRIALGIINNEERSFLNSLFQIKRRNIIIKKLLEYFEAFQQCYTRWLCQFSTKRLCEGSGRNS